MTGEVIDFSDIFDIASTLALEVGHITNATVPLQLLTVCKRLFKIISKRPQTSGKRMMLDTFVGCGGFKEGVISDIGFLRSYQKVADWLMSVMQQKELQMILSEGRLVVKPEKWIIRK